MKEPAIWLYRKLTTRPRRELWEQLRAQRKMPIAILFYHRVADVHPNAWTMSCKDYARQLDWIQANFDVVPLAEAQRRIQAEYCDRPTVAITFDDGYADNADFAIPELARRGMPATYFVATEFIASNSPFPHDAQAGVPLAPNTREQLLSFQDCGIEIGAHTRRHPDLGALSRKELHDEIAGSVRILEQWLGNAVQYFAVPYGMPANISQEAFDIIRETGLAGFCSAYGAMNWPNNQGFHLRRIHADPGIERLKNWLTLDARKLDDKADLPFHEPEMQLPQLAI